MSTEASEPKFDHQGAHDGEDRDFFAVLGGVHGSP